ncbi:MAG: CBS domain-containing protein [Rhizobiales bacterium]|nr:CBS domain-containing protein [Hyphomicrobiales bacterium]
MKVESILNAKGREVKAIGPAATLATAAQRLRMERIGALVVLDSDRIVGIISERDIVHAFAADSERAGDIEVAVVMTRNVISCGMEDSLTRVLGLMTRHRIRHLPVMQDSRLHGLISIGDVVKYRLDELELEASVLRDSYFAGR